jgi:hypothetical protein
MFAIGVIATTPIIRSTIYSGYYPEYGMGAPVADVANVAVGLATLPFAAAFGVW